MAMPDAKKDRWSRLGGVKVTGTLAMVKKNSGSGV